MGPLLLAVVLVILAIAFWKPNIVINLVNGFFKVIPLGYAGIRTRFGKFAAKQKSGLMFVLPVVHEVKMVPLNLHFRIPITAQVQTMEGDSIDVNVVLVYNVDFEFLETYYYALKNGQQGFENMVGGSIITLIGNVASTKTLEQFYQEREALWLALNCHTRLSVMPHVNPALIGLKIKRISAGKVLDFYDQHKKAISELVNHETENKDDHSEIELRYGINAITVEVGQIVFSKETQDAINRKKRDEAMAGAAKFKTDLIKKLQDECKLSPEAAKQAAEVSLGQTTDNKAFSVLGLSGLIQVGGGK